MEVDLSGVTGQRLAQTVILSHVTPAEEREYLERVLAYKAKPNLSPAGTLGRLAQLHLEVPAGPHSAERALLLVNAGMMMEGKGSPLYPKFRHYAAMALRSLLKPPPDALGPKGTAAVADREAFQLSLDANPRDALTFAEAWADWAWSRNLFDEAGEAYTNAHRAQSRILLRETESEEARLQMLGNTHFATQGAYALYKAGKREDAIVLLEQTSLSALNAPRQRSDLLRLAKVAPDLSAKLFAAMNSSSEARRQAGLDVYGGLSPEEKQARAETDSLVAEIRRIPGFESFAKKVSWSEVVRASAAMPLVYLVSTVKGSVAMIVASKDEKTVSLGAIDIRATVLDVQAAFKNFVGVEYGTGVNRQNVLFSLLEWLGSNVMIAVKMLLSELSPEERPFVLIPFGFLASLPIHLGIIHPNETRSQSLFHPRHITFAYSAVGHALSQRLAARESAAPHALIISNPRPIPPSYNDLFLCEYEARMVASHFPAEVLAGRDADTNSVVERLPAATHAHFCCHGTVDARFGYTGVLLLANTESLNYQHLRDLEELSARLVVLSACTTGTAALAIDHGISLPNAFLAAGAAAVLGTFWHTDELASLLLLTRFYQLWLGPQPHRALVQALGDAQEWIMITPARDFKAILPPEVLESPAAEFLKRANDDDRIYAHPWYWGGFFIAGV